MKILSYRDFASRKTLWIAKICPVIYFNFKLENCNWMKNFHFHLYYNGHSVMGYCTMCRSRLKVCIANRFTARCEYFGKKNKKVSRALDGFKTFSLKINLIHILNMKEIPMNEDKYQTQTGN